MKAIVFLLLSILFVVQNSSAQTVFAPQGAVWNYYREGEPPLYNSKYMTEKDTFYEGHYCAKVIGVKTYLGGLKEILKTNYFYTSGDTVLYYHDSLKAFTPLYIFNVKVGDTLTYAAPIWYYKSLKTYKIVVSKIDTNIIDGTSLRTIHEKIIDTPAAYTIKYTERFGGYYVANIISIIGPTTTDHIEGIRCYRDKEIDEKFVSDKWDCDYIPTDIEEKINENNIQIYPNPASQTLTIRLSKSMSEGKINITGLDGRTLIQQNFESTKTELNLERLSDGIYILQLSDGIDRFSKMISVVR